MLLLSELLLLPARSMGQLADAASQQHQQHPQHLGLGLLMAPVAGLQAVNGWFAGMADMAEQVGCCWVGGALQLCGMADMAEQVRTCSGGAEWVGA